MRLSLTVPAVLLIAVGSVPVRAEYLKIEMRVSGLECASCADSVPKRLLRIRGVTSAEYKDLVATMSLEPGNRVPLNRVRDALKGLGYTPEEAKVEVKGSIVEENGKCYFQPAGLAEKLIVEGKTNSESASTFAGTIPKLERPTDTDVIRLQ